MRKLLVVVGVIAALLPIGASANSYYVAPGVVISGGTCAATPPAGEVYYDTNKTITVDYTNAAFAVDPLFMSSWVTYNGPSGHGRPSSKTSTLPVSTFSATVFSRYATNQYTYWVYNQVGAVDVSVVLVAPCP